MIRQLLSRVFRKSATSTPRARLSSTDRPAVIYAVGDVHGCLAELLELEQSIVADAAQFDGEPWIVMLGDYVDRGPRSADVLDHLTGRAPAGFKRICLAGNHETMMLGFLGDPRIDSDWLRFGGEETLASYGIDIVAFRRAANGARRAILDSHIPHEHLEFLNELPVLLTLPGLNLVHAGLRPGQSTEAQVDEDLLWIREPFLSGSGSIAGLTIHGHTPTPEPECVDNRVGIDTGAFASGVLTAVRILADDSLAFTATRPHGQRK